jgi:hypothetical protein
MIGIEMEAEIAESKRVLQQQLDIQRLYARTPLMGDNKESNSLSPNKDRHSPYSPDDVRQRQDVNETDTSVPEKCIFHSPPSICFDDIS